MYKALPVNVIVITIIIDFIKNFFIPKPNIYNYY